MNKKDLVIGKSYWINREKGKWGKLISVDEQDGEPNFEPNETLKMYGNINGYVPMFSDMVKSEKTELDE